MSADGPLVSVVIPAYNSSRTIRETVQSALDQQAVNLDIVVVDDGSTDDTAEMVGTIADSRVRVVRQPNGGAPTARNTGIQHATGEWVAFLDADDLWVPHKLKAQLEAVSAVPDGFAVHAGAFLVDDDLRTFAVRHCVQPKNTLLAFLRFQNLPAVASSWLVRRDVLEQIGGFDSGLTILEDWDFSINLARHGDVVHMYEPLTYYRQHPGNRSRNLDIHIDSGARVLARLFSDPGLPAEVRAQEREIYGRFYTMLCGGAFRVQRWRTCAYWGVRALRTDPRMIAYMAATPIRRIRRRMAAATAPDHA